MTVFILKLLREALKSTLVIISTVLFRLCSVLNEMKPQRLDWDAIAFRLFASANSLQE